MNHTDMRSGPPPDTETRPKDSALTTATTSVQLATDKLPDVWASTLAPGRGQHG